MVMVMVMVRVSVRVGVRVPSNIVKRSSPQDGECKILPQPKHRAKSIAVKSMFAFAWLPV
jgi:hypothetical protein